MIRMRAGMCRLSPPADGVARGGGCGGWLMDQTYAATALTASSGIGTMPRSGIASPVYEREAGTPCFTRSIRDS